MNKESLIQTIKKDFWITKTNRISIQKLGSKNNEEIEASLINYSLIIPTNTLVLAERFYVIENNLTRIPTCICGKELKFKNYQKGYHQFCSKSCMYEARQFSFFKKIERLDLSNIANISNEEASTLILENFVINNKLINGSTRDLGLSSNHLNLVKYLKNRFKDRSTEASIPEMFYQIVKNDFVIPKCKCSKPLAFNSFEVGYNQYCSSRCVSFYTREQTKATNLRNLGVEFPTQNKSVMKKQEVTNLKRRGVKNVSQDPKVQQTREATFIKNHKKTNPMKVKDLAEKCRLSNIANNGKHSLSKLENHQKSKNAINKKYGKPFYSQTEDYKSRHEEIEQNRIDMVQGKYHVDYVTQTKEHIQKVIDTKRKNGTFNTSKPEKELFKFLQAYYPLTEQHKQIPNSKRNCDYYIPELDLWVELHGFHSHNYKEFEPNNPEHLQELNDLKRICEEKEAKKKGSGWVEAGKINVWSVRDLYKKQLLKDLGFKYYAIYDYKDFNKVLETIKLYH